MATIPRHEAMDAETVAGLLGVSTRQLNNYINLKGLPSNGSGRQRTFVWGDVLEWFIGYRLSLETGDGNGGSDDDEFGDSTSVSGGKKEDIRQANLRKTKAEANLKELQLGRLRGEVISIAEAKTRLDRMMSNLRAKLLSMPPKLANRIEGEKTRAAREGLIRTEIETLCREISTGAVVDVPSDAIDDDTLELSAAASPEFMAGLNYLSHPQALAELNALIRAARDFKSSYLFWRANHARH